MEGPPLYSSQGVVCQSVRDCDCRESQNPHPFDYAQGQALSQNARQGWGTLELRGLELGDGVKPFCGLDRLNRIGV
jgi:hypothetical protein